LKSKKISVHTPKKYTKINRVKGGGEGGEA
jgi:hypothetical protein